MPTEEENRLPKKRKILKFHLLMASILFGFDALIFGQGVIAFLVLVIFFSRATIQAAIAIARNTPFPRAAFVKAGIYLGCFMAILSTIMLNNRVARKRADLVVSAIKQYREKHSQYPDTLQSLVPEFLPSVPKAKYAFAYNDFFYRRIPKDRSPDDPAESAMFFYTALPPFGRPTYNFEKDRWGYVD